MKLREIMTQGVELVTPETMLQEAAQKMKDIDAGVMPVCDGWELVGILTDRDIVIRSTAEGQNPGSTRVADVMSREVAFCFEDEDTARAAELMKERQIRRLPILDRNRRLIGIISLGDLAVDTGDDSMSGDVLEQVSRPARPER